VPGKQAKILSNQQLPVLVAYASTTRYPLRNQLIIFLSVKAGLRAGEIAKLTWDMIRDATGEIGCVIELRDCIAKKGGGRLIPMHSDLRAVLQLWGKITGTHGPVVRSERGGAMSPGSIVNWFATAYQA
jgi:integrase